MNWPEIPFEPWRDTAHGLHLRLQVVGKIRVALAPWENHQWHVTLRLTPRGLTTRPIPHGNGTFSLDLDFVDHTVRVESSNGRRSQLPLEAGSVADFHETLLGTLDSHGIEVEMHGVPNELPDPVPFEQDTEARPYDREAVSRWFRVLANTARIFEDFRGDFIGKSSPVHFFWGAMDLAVTRFSGRRAPEHPGGIPHLPDWITREAYSHEVSSAGFWAGGESHPEPIFYAYAYPNPAGYPEAEVQPEAARWNDTLQEFILPYAAVRNARDPGAALQAFLDSTYHAAATLADWDREPLEWPPGGRPPVGGRKPEG